MTEWFREHLWITYLLIFVLISYVYNKVFRTRRLPVLKAAVIYLLLAAGAFILLLFQVDVGLPIVPSLAIALFLMLIVRVRYWIQAKSGRKS